MSHPLEITTLFDLSTFEHKDLFDGCTYPWEVLPRLKSYILAKTSQQNSNRSGSDPVNSPINSLGAYILNPESVIISEGTIVEPGACIKGPCIIGRNCEIRHGAYIRGNVLIGDNCVIGHTTELKSVVFLNHVKAAHFAFVGDSILGNEVNLGAGTKCANLRLDGKPVVIRYEGGYPTGERKIGAFLGDHVQIGCNAVLNPGTLLGKKCMVEPLALCSGVHGSQSIIKSGKQR